MRSLLDALQEGRLIELPVNDKDKALEYLALLIEAIPDIGTDSDIVRGVKEREALANTSIGMGVACPHVRTSHEGELLCAVGWSPEGIDYDAIDGKRVHLMVMYYIPDSQRNVYLKEISGLAKAIKETEGIEPFTRFTDIQSIRHRLLDWVEIAINKALPDSKARMIKLEAKQSAVISETPAAEPEIAPVRHQIIPFTLVCFEQGKFMVLSPDAELAETLEQSHEISRLISSDGDFELGGYQIAVSLSKNFAMNRVLYECVAVK